MRNLRILSKTKLWSYLRFMRDEWEPGFQVRQFVKRQVWAEMKEVPNKSVHSKYKLKVFSVLFIPSSSSTCMVCVSELRSLDSGECDEPWRVDEPSSERGHLHSWNATVGMFWDFIFIQTCPTRSFVLINGLSLSPPNILFNTIVTTFQTRALASSSLGWRSCVVRKSSFWFCTLLLNPDVLKVCFISVISRSLAYYWGGLRITRQNIL